ncbi:MAG: histidinol dehydrogenase [Bacteroidota bacterium]|jgi:histidinol dehydrogenase|nr:histidinol dehydrogenase [Cytophagales bacterium]MCE2958171.1 histidinol dehydrogenase [Flammeovirgaceae bacterium]MCZ8069997.1 histidinol dehydrogenase [Cytophagales bacterium]
MKILIEPGRAQWPALCQRPQLETDFLDGTVRNILTRVKQSGDAALREFNLQFDKVKLTNLLVPQAEITEATESITDELKAAIKQAAQNIQKFHAAQKREVSKIETMPGVVCWRKAVPIQKVGIYVPGGSAPLFSTVLMLAIPAALAGCEEVVLCTPPDKQGKINPAILFAAQITGVKKIFKVGGAQAIAAMAYGTESIPQVSKIFGPGNQYVTKAKQLVNTEGLAIDMPAGPSEVLVLAGNSANPVHVAADLLSQAEHGGDSQVVLVASEKKLVDEVINHIQQQLERLPRKSIAQEALRNSLGIVLESTQSQIDFINQYAPEHLILNTSGCDAIADQIVNAGSIFLGPYSPESVGDYASGTNHTLPTAGYAKAYGGVSLESFTKYITIQKLSPNGLANIANTVIAMAEAEQLQGHANAVKVRL